MKNAVHPPSKRMQGGHVGGGYGPMKASSRFLNHHPFAWNYASLEMRFVASAVDAAVIAFVTCFLLWAEYGDAWILDSDIQPDMSTYIALSILPFLYFVGSWSVFSASLGKLILSLQIVDASTGEPITVAQSLYRYFGYGLVALSFGLGLVGVFHSRSAQGWHDKLAHTVVIRR